MNNLFLLTKASFLSGFNVNKKKGNQKSTFTTLILFGILFLALSIFYNVSIAMAYQLTGNMNDYFITILSFAGFLSLVLSITKAQSAIYKTKDYEFLQSLPVTQNEIIGSKVLSMYLLTLAEDVIICLPAIVIYTLFTGNFFAIVVGLVAILFVSMLPSLVAVLIGFVITLLTAKSKHENIITIILFVVIFSVAFLLPYTMGATSSGESQVATLDFISKIMPHMVLVRHSLDIARSYELIIFVLINVVALALVIYIISLSYRKINTWILSGQNHEEYVVTGKNESTTSLFKTLLHKEWKFVSKKGNYFVNSYLGPFIGLMSGIAFVFIIKEIGIENEDYAEIASTFSVIIASFLLMMNSMMTSTSASISLEGPSFGMLKSYPIPPKDIIRAKHAIGIIVPTVENIIIATILSFLLPTKSTLLIIELFVFPIIATIFSANVGMLCGLKWPKLEFSNELQVFKNSMAVNLTMLFSVIPSIIAMGINVALSFFVPMIIPFIIILFIYAVGIAITTVILVNSGERLFNKIKV